MKIFFELYKNKDIGFLNEKADSTVIMYYGSHHQDSIFIFVAQLVHLQL